MINTQLLPIIYGRLLAREASQTSKQMKEVLQGTGIDEDGDKRHAGGMTIGQYRILLGNSQRVSGDSYITLKAAANLPPTIHGPVGIAVSTSPTLQDSLGVLVHYGCLRNPFFRIHLSEEGRYTRCIIEMDRELEEQMEPALDFIVSIISNQMMAVAAMPIRGLSLELNRPRPADAPIFESWIPCPVRYDQEEDVLVFPTSELAREVLSANPEIYLEAIERCNDIYSSQHRPANEVDAVGNLFARMSGQICTIQNIAGVMGMTARTLQRRLKGHGTSYQSLLDDWLAKEAAKYLLEENLTVEVTRMLLGYRDEANFRRAFKRWYGMSPGTYRLLKR